MATAQIAPIAKDFNVGKRDPVRRRSTLTVALIVDGVCNGGARPLFGWVSDNIGREYTMAIAFGLGAVAYWLLGSLGATPWFFVVFAALIFLTWGEIFSLFPSTCTDTFGAKFATVNLSLLYTAKGTSAFLVPVANVIKTQRQLARGVRRDRVHEHRGRGVGAVRAQADAARGRWPKADARQSELPVRGPLNRGRRLLRYPAINIRSNARCARLARLAYCIPVMSTPSHQSRRASTREP